MIEYVVAAHPTKFMGIQFRSRLEARWAAFLELWEPCSNWEYEPIDLRGWMPDFWVQLPCRHSECSPFHELYAEVRPYRTIQTFYDAQHPVTKIDPYSTPTPAMFGISPEVSAFELAHGCGGGIYSILYWGRYDPSLWREAGNMVQWFKE